MDHCNAVLDLLCDLRQLIALRLMDRDPDLAAEMRVVIGEMEVMVMDEGE